LTTPRGTGAGPLQGIVVADLSTVLAGPWCTMLLGDLGADVIKVEPPDGDPTRGYGPPYAGAPEAGATYAEDDPRAQPGYPGESAYYLAANRNKRAIRVDLKRERGRDVVARLLERSDVVVENYRAGGFARLGFPEEKLRELNPRLMHLAITGYGPDGPDADRPGYDFVIQAVAGLMSITGDVDANGGRPTKVGVAIADLTTGMLAAVAVLAAIVARDRGHPGQRIDLSVLEATVSWLANQATNYLVGGVVPGRMGNRHPNITPYESFPTADGEIVVTVGADRQWSRLCEVLGLPEIARDPRFASNAGRVAARAELRPLLEARFRERSSNDWLERLRSAEVPAGPINDIAAVFSDPQVLARGMVESIPHPTIGEVRVPGIPFKLEGTPASVRHPPPTPAQHTGEILTWLGYDETAVRELRADGTV
jgi:crotonobetainyl-CoA:carnitine CoA-transferase CaiB-like acyl-CoA transferase